MSCGRWCLGVKEEELRISAEGAAEHQGVRVDVVDREAKLLQNSTRSFMTSVVEGSSMAPRSSGTMPRDLR